MLPFCSRPTCLPVLFRLWGGKGTTTPVELACEMLIHVAGERAFPTATTSPWSATPPTSGERLRATWTPGSPGPAG